MLKFLIKKEKKKYKNVYELAKDNCDRFEKENDYSKFTKETIDIIECDISRLSRQGVRQLEYHIAEFHVHTDMNEVRKYFESQGFKIYRWSSFLSQYGIFRPIRCLSAEIIW